MGKPVLIAYASRAGSTAEVAVAMGKRLSQDGTPVEVHRIGQVSDPSAYRAVIVGSAVRMGQWLPEAADFVKKHRAVLLQRPTAYFSCGATLREDTPKDRSEMESFVDPVRQIMEPVASGLLAGKMDYSRLSLLMRPAVLALQRSTSIGCHCRARLAVAAQTHLSPSLPHEVSCV